MTGYDFSNASHVYVFMDGRNEGINFFAYDGWEPLDSGDHLSESSNPFLVYSLFKTIDEQSTLVTGSPEDELEKVMDREELL